MITNASGSRVDAPPSAIDDIAVMVSKNGRSFPKWQDSVLSSLVDSGWTPEMLVMVPMVDPRHWFQRLLDVKQTSPLALQQTMIEAIGLNTMLWHAFACTTLHSRGWGTTAIGRAFGRSHSTINERLVMFRKWVGDGNATKAADSYTGEASESGAGLGLAKDTRSVSGGAKESAVSSMS